MFVVFDSTMLKNRILLKFIQQSIILVAVILFVAACIPFNWLKPVFDQVIARDGDFALLTTSTVVMFRALFIAIGLILLGFVNWEINWVRVYALIFAFLYGVICAAQVLGFFRIYRLGIVLPFIVTCTMFLFWAYSKYWFRDFHTVVFHRKQDMQFLNYTFWAIGVFLLIFLILLPLISWPYSPINRTLNWDVGKYHLPKALELANTGSAWDLTISYGEYPYGYESLFAFAALISKSEMLFGSMHALGVLFFVLTVWLLLCRYTNLPVGLNFLMVVCLLISGLVWRDRINNIWWIYRVVVYDMIGKNDLFLAAGVLAIILHAPVGLTQNPHSWNLQGMALATMIALSTKPNAVFVIIVLWALVLFFMFSGFSAGIYQKIRTLFPYALLIIPGTLWIFRNLFAQGVIFSPAVLRLQNQSILNNLTNPSLYSRVSLTMVVVTSVLIWSFYMALLHKRITWIFWTAQITLFLSFISTPASGFVHPTSETANFSWRFGVSVLTYTFIVIVVGVEPWVLRWMDWLFGKSKMLQLLLCLSIFSLALLVFSNNRWYFLPALSNARVLEDQYGSSVGVDGYNSAFDYIHKNVRHSVIWVENGLPFYVYGPGFTNSTTLLSPPDYFVVLRTAWQKGDLPDYPPELTTESWNENWLLVYEDGEGRVYRHR